MHFKLDFEGNNEIGVYAVLTNKYAIVGRSQSDNVINFFREKVNFPIVETTINNIVSIGSQAVGNSHGLIVSGNCSDQELMHIRNSLPEDINVVRIHDKLNALGNNILCNDHIAIVNPNFNDTDLLEKYLKVPVYKMTLGSIPLVGAFGSLNSVGLIVHPEMTDCEIKELSDLLKVKVISSTVNSGKREIGSGILVNDFMCITGNKCTNVEVTIAETVFGLTDSDVDERALVDDIVY